MPQVKFCIDYTTAWGERLYVDYKADGVAATLPLETEDGIQWTATADIPAGTETLCYAYRVSRDGNAYARAEQAGCRTVSLTLRPRLLLSDAWMERPLPHVLRRTAFTHCVFRPDTLQTLDVPYVLCLHAAPPPAGWRWGVLGSSGTLGRWQPENVKMMQRSGVYEWETSLLASDFAAGAEYKYVLVNETDPRRLVWEEGANRQLRPHPMQKEPAARRTDDTPRISMKAWRGAGVVIPVFSLRSKGSWGIGDFGDLCHLIHWAASVNMRAVQLLPINDTTATHTWHDSYPYNGISVFALHPIYINANEWSSSAAFKKHRDAAQALNKAAEVDYEAVEHLKTQFLRDLFLEKGAGIMRTKGYKDFLKNNTHWLPAYAAFCHLRDAYSTANFRHWKHCAQYSHTDIEAYFLENPTAEREREFHCFVQYILHRQMSKAHELARTKGIVLKGDIPIGICRDSVAAWADTRLFHFDGQAGAPPDAFAANGQNWGFPTYNWQEMEKDGYAWWRARLQSMGAYFDAYRVDHVLGFFRIWEVPFCHIHGILGRFRPALPLTQEEIEHWGFDLEADRLTRPLITNKRLEELSEEVGGAGLKRFFRPVDADTEAPFTLPDGGTWHTLQPEADTQRKIMSLVPEGQLRDILLNVCTEVLFITDTDDAHRYHPRITAQHSRLFALLSEKQKQCFNRLYDNFFYFRHNDFWAKEARKKFHIIVGHPDNAAGTLLPCAEDLGMVPSSVKGVLEDFGMLSLEIQRMPKRYGVRFDNLQDNPYLSVATIATHDMPPLRLWWRESREQTEAFWHQALGHRSDAPQEATPETCEQVVAEHLESPSMLCLLALQDLLAMDGALRRDDPAAEQINVPSNPNQYWRYRMHLGIEELAAASAFNEKLRGIIARAGR